MPIEQHALTEIAQFFAGQPTPEQILDFHASDAVADRAYLLVAVDYARTITPDERRELDRYEALEDIVRYAKVEARRKLAEHGR